MQQKFMRILKAFSPSIVAIFLLSLLSSNNACGAQDSASIGLNKIKQCNNLIQFKAGNHVLGFASSKVYLASLDHALTLEFIGTEGVMPEADGDLLATSAGTEAQALKKVFYQNLWEGISLSYNATREGITESTYHVAAGADVSKIKLKYNVPVELQKNGSIKFRFDNGNMTESAPIAWQEIDGKRKLVPVSFNISRYEVGFSIGKYDKNRPLTIDPVYSWNTFYGSGNGDAGVKIAVDSNGNMYVTGYSTATWKGPSGQSPLNAYSDGSNEGIFVLKLNSSGAYQWHTFYGGSSGDYGEAIAVDGSGNVYVTGHGYDSWGTPLNAFSGPQDFFVLKLNSSGVYQWNTFYGSGDYDYGYGITVDSSGGVYVTGSSFETWGTPLNAFSGSGDFFVLKLNSSGAYQWNTFYGSGNGDYGSGIAVDGSANVYVTGFSYGTWGTPINAISGEEFFVLKLNSSGAYQWNTFYGSGSADEGYGITVDGSANVYVTGFSYGTWGTPLNAFSGSRDIFVLKLNSSGAHQWNTFYGSGKGDTGYDISVDGSDSVYVTGYSLGTWGTPLHAFNGYGDIFVLKLNSDGAYQWNTFYGSGYAEFELYDNGFGIRLDSSGNVDVTGYSYENWEGPGTCLTAGIPPCPLNPFSGISGSGSSDIFVLQLQLDTCPANNPVEIEDTDTPYGSFLDAYDAAVTGQSILMQAVTVFSGTLDLERPVEVTLQGGYECGFPSAPPGRSTINGSVTISGGTVTIANLIIQ
ncbi:MAG: SBBP repeat-containing protein [Dissulfurispiraceae bacterium]|jgi:hypothetical protein